MEWLRPFEVVECEQEQSMNMWKLRLLGGAAAAVVELEVSQKGRWAMHVTRFALSFSLNVI